MNIARPARSPVTNGVATLHDIMVPMRDGARLATDVYLPARDGAILPSPFPVVLERTPYLKTRNQTNTPDGAFWASRGYVFVTQDCRGRHKSDGVFISYPVEGDDGAWSGGAFQMTHNINYALGLAVLGKEAQANLAVRLAFENSLETKEAFKLMQRSPLAPGQSVMALAPSYDDWYQEWQQHELYDDYWQQDGYRFDYSAAPDVRCC